MNQSPMAYSLSISPRISENQALSIPEPNASYSNPSIRGTLADCEPELSQDLDAE